MSQQMKNGSHYQGSVTYTYRDTYRYGVVNEPFKGKHRKPQDDKSLAKRKLHWALRKSK